MQVGLQLYYPYSLSLGTIFKVNYCQKPLTRKEGKDHTQRSKKQLFSTIRLCFIDFLYFRSNTPYSMSAKI